MRLMHIMALIVSRFLLLVACVCRFPLFFVVVNGIESVRFFHILILVMKFLYY